MVGVRRVFTTQEADITYRDEMAHAMQGSSTHHYKVQPITWSFTREQLMEFQLRWL